MGNDDIGKIKLKLPKSFELKADKASSCGCGTDKAGSCCGTDKEVGSCGIDKDVGSCGTSVLSEEPWMTGFIDTPAGKVPVVSTVLSTCDRWGSFKVRFDINRMDYRIEPGLYAVGAPDRGSPVLVTANYKLTFDALRKELGGLDAWVLVLDTKGINVWCAAGKGTFGTEEIIRRVAATGLHKVVDHRTLILPQLGAPGTSAHKVSAAAGFKVVYGPVRAADIKKFIKDGYKATPEMRRVEFKLYDRFVLTPVELAQIVPKTLLVLGVLFILNAAGLGPFGLVELYAVLGALAAGCFLTPLLLPFIPGRAFAWKGFLLGLIWAIIVNLLNGWPGEPSYGWLKAIGFILALPPISSYLAMNFTGASTYTSPSGVLKEMKISLPPMLVSLFAGCVLILANNIIGA